MADAEEEVEPDQLTAGSGGFDSILALFNQVISSSSCSHRI